MQRMDQTQNDPQRQLNEAMMQVARGPSNPCSVMGLHSLLEDMYGNGTLSSLSAGVPIQIYSNDVNSTPATTIASGGAQMRSGPVFIDPTVSTSWGAGGQLIWIMAPPGISRAVKMRCTGGVLTMLDGPAAGQSTRIVEYDSVNDRFHLLAFAGQTINMSAGEQGWIMVNGVELSGNYIINDKPFSGTGFGFNPGTGQLDLAFDPSSGLTTTTSSTTWPVALLPNTPISAYIASPDPLIANAQGNPPGGANEDYDAPDYQNMLLAAQIPQTTPANWVATLPSLHRPALVNYWLNWYRTTMSLPSAQWWQLPVNLQARMMLRPRADANPDFTGGNPYFNPARTNADGSTNPEYNSNWPVHVPGYNPTWNGVFAGNDNFNSATGRKYQTGDTPDGICDYQWDVDNDGDGIPDSIWVDLGFPVRASKEGKLFKPLFAILCVDMDGRVNLNAHGNLAQAGSPTETPSTFAASYFAGGTAPTTTGRGFGPAEINPSYVLGSNTLYQHILVGNGTYEGRYGTDYNASGNPVPIPRPGTAGSADFSKLGNAANLFAPGYSSYNDYLSANKWSQFEGLYQNSAAQPASALNVQGLASIKGYGEVPDPEGKGATGIDPAGRPILQNLWIPDPSSAGNLIPSNFLDRPYELNLGLKTSRGLPGQSGTPDNPFSVNELERILRPFDRDATSLPDRLAKLTSPTGAASDSVLIGKRNEVTTESWDVPALVPGLPPHILNRVQTDLKAGTVAASQISWLPPHNVTDLLKAYYYYELITSGGQTPSQAATQAESMVSAMSVPQLLQLFPPEMLAGLKMNINRPLRGPGNGSAADTNAFDKVALWQSLGLSGNYGDFWFGQMPEFPDGNADAGYYFPGVDAAHIYAVNFPARQLYARYLYVLALLLRDRAPDGRAQWFTEDVTGHEDELMKRRIAQWAINAVCFRTSDSIMAPFEYDTDPLGYSGSVINGWRVDGVIGTNPTGGTNDDTQTYRRLVWGCKPPELILTETLAFHDRRAVDTRWDTTWKNQPGGKTGDPKPHDNDYDQARVPQGSALFELYCPRDLYGSAAPPDLYNSDGQLDLGRLAPAAGGMRYPVWRIVISESTLKNPGPHDNNINWLKNHYPDRLSFEPEQYHGQGAIPGQGTSLSLLKNDPDITALATIDRIVWFTSQQPTTHTDANRVYYNYGNMPALLERGHYAVVGPRTTTLLGLNCNDKSDLTNYPFGNPSPQHITIPAAPGSPTVTDIRTGQPDPNIDANTIKTPVLGIIAGNTPSGWDRPVGVSISEPLLFSYYPKPAVPGPDGVVEWYADPHMTDATLGNQYFYDRPLDKTSGYPLAAAGETIPYSGTVTNYKTVFLQRLANPLAAYDPTSNPYLTVDWMPIDLTVFNGEEDPNPDPETPDSPDFPALKTDVKFGARQRGISDFSATEDPPFPAAVASNSDNYKNNLWAPLSNTPAVNDKAKTDVNFDYKLEHSLGYLNKAFWASASPHWITNSSIGQNGDPLVGSTMLFDAASQIKPFPWLPWFGRPYVNQLELMLVPASHPARLLWEFQPCTGTTSDYQAADKDHAPFPELLNFMQAGTSNGMNQFARVLDYVAVPSWFAGTELQVNPTYAAAAAPGSHTFFPPYNNISTYREPGRINLNTVYTQDVFSGLMNGAASPTLSQLSTSRGDNFPVMNAAYPTEVAHPFRSLGGGAMVPQLDDKTGAGGTTGPLGLDYLKPNYEIDASYMRRDATVSTKPLFQSTSTNPVDNTDRNPFFHYQELERLGNLVTTRSNVYAVWITVGYFEVKPNRITTPAGLPDAAHPDGYELGQELGSDTGEIVRHRAFYMIDRTIPVGFQRGQDVNVEKAIILKRFIE
jgi:hypothetical protein